MRKHIKNSKLGRAISSKFDNELHFIKTWVGSPKTTGSIMPTGAKMARSMASLVRPGSGLPVLELGPGTGPITRAILDRGIAPGDLYALEYSKEFLCKLGCTFPGVNFIHGDAFDLDTSLAEIDVDKFDTIISGLPLLNFPKKARHALIEASLDRLPEGRPLVQFSYGAVAPVSAKRGSFSVDRHEIIMRNVPPAQVWLYRR